MFSGIAIISSQKKFSVFNCFAFSVYCSCRLGGVKIKGLKRVYFSNKLLKIVVRTLYENVYKMSSTKELKSTNKNCATVVSMV